jgi:hypothetical protein
LQGFPKGDLHGYTRGFRPHYFHLEDLVNGEEVEKDEEIASAPCSGRNSISSTPPASGDIYMYISYLAFQLIA